MIVPAVSLHCTQGGSCTDAAVCWSRVWSDLFDPTTLDGSHHGGLNALAC